MSENIPNKQTSKQLLLETIIGFWSARGTIHLILGSQYESTVYLYH